MTEDINSEAGNVSFVGMLKRPPAIYVVLGFLSWWMFVVVSGQQILSLTKWKWNFEATGQLGDSFGIFSAFMASMAAIFTYQTLVDTRSQSRKADLRYKKQIRESSEEKRVFEAEQKRLLAREIERDRRDALRSSEQTYFMLLESRNNLLKEMTIGSGSTKLDGGDAVNRIESNIFLNIRSKGIKEVYDFHYRLNINKLAHYYRFTYHVIAYADRNFDFDKAYELIRYLRAQLSNAELVLISLNCVCGEGEGQFYDWIHKYSLLHNISPESRKAYGLDSVYKPSAFERGAVVDASLVVQAESSDV